MLYIYSSKTALKVYPNRNLLSEICERAKTNDVDAAFQVEGYSKTLTVGDDVAEIELFLSHTDTEFKAIAHVSLGGTYMEYAMASHHDALEFMKEYTPTIKVMVELHDRNERKAGEQQN